MREKWLWRLVGGAAWGVLYGVTWVATMYVLEDVMGVAKRER